MDQITIREGSRTVHATRNDEGHPWSSRLYVGGAMEIATLQTAKHKTEAGLRRWAKKMLRSLDLQNSF
jgi:hypothetical protein